MITQNQKIIDFFQRRIVGVYEKTSTRKVADVPKIVLEKQEVPYTETENYNVNVDDGMQWWVFLVVGAISVFGIVFLLKGLYVASTFFFLFAIGCFLAGRRYFRNILTETHQRVVNKTRVENISREIPQFRDEIIPANMAVKRFGYGTMKFGVSAVNGVRYLTSVNFTSSNQKFSYPVVEQANDFMSEFYDIESKLKNIPFVLGGEKSGFKINDNNNGNVTISLCGIEKEIMDHLISTEYVFSNMKMKKFSSNLFEESPLKNYLCKTEDMFINAGDELLDALASSESLDVACTDWLEKWPVWLKIMANSRFDSVTKQVIPEFVQFSHHSQYSCFNFYCPDCNKEISEELMRRDYSVHSNEDLSPQRFSRNTRCHYILDLNAWRCPMCEKIIPSPIPMHKALDEIFLPVYDNLMEENKVLREKDYSEVRKKEIEFKNEMKKELERIYFDNLNGILGLKDEMERFKAEIDGETEAINFIKEVFSSYKDLQSKLIDAIEESNKKIKEEIQERAHKILEEVDKVKDREMTILSRELTELSKAKRLDDERRDAVQQKICAAHLETNSILNNKFNELIDTNRTGFGQVTKSINSLEETNKQGFQSVRTGLDNVEKTTRTGFEKSFTIGQNIQKELRFNNAMKAASNRAQGLDPNDDSSLLRPLRSIRRGINQVSGRLGGRSTAEIDMKDIDLIIG